MKRLLALLIATLMVLTAIAIVPVGATAANPVWSEWRTVVEPTCTEIGYKVRVDTNVTAAETPEEQTETIEPLGHTFGEWEVDVAPTCENEGWGYHVCTVCGIGVWGPIDPIGHDYGDWITVKEAVCYDENGPEHNGEGYEIRICNNDPSHIEGRVIEALEHNWSDWEVVTAATCAGVEYDPDTQTYSGIGLPGEEVRECAVDPDHIERREIPALTQHTMPNEPVRENDNEAACENHNGTREWDDVYYCTVCGEEIYREHQIFDLNGSHREAAPVQENVVEASCFTDGSYEEVTYCELCGKELKRVFPNADEDRNIIHAPMAHTHKTEQIEKVNPTCVVSGYVITRDYCEVCGVEFSVTKTVLPPRPHVEKDPVKENEIKTPACEVEAGYDSVVYCKNCGFEISRVWVKTADALEHDYGDWYVAYDATCTEYGLRLCVCANDANQDHILSESILPLGHNWSEWDVTTEPTCTEEGYRVRHCLRCEKDYDDDEEAAEIAIIDGIFDIRAEGFSANFEGETLAELLAALEARRAAAKVQVSRVMPALGHDFGRWHTDIEPTCEEYGVEYRQCHRTGCEFVDERLIDPVGHLWSDWEVTVAPTRDTDGEQKRICVRDRDNTHYEVEVIPAIGHVAGEAVIENEVAAACEAEGRYDSVIYCVDEDCLDENGRGKELSRETIVVPATGHTAGEAVIENEVAATCAADGSYDTVVYCTVCNKEISRETTVVPALEHTAGEAVIENEVAATCEADGSYDTVVYCTVCGGEISRETTVVPATGHTAGEAVIENEVAATCEADGSYDTVVYCTVCGGEISRETTVVPAAGHTAGEAKNENEVAATCEADGSYDTVVYCTVCNKEISRETIVVPATGHTAGEAKIENEVAATCEATGSYDTVVYCTVCNKELSRVTTIVPATGHTAGEAKTENEVAATCEADGSYDTVVYCTVCNKEISRETTVVPATGHAWGEWTETVAPTYTAEGVETRVCATCGKTETRAIAKLEQLLGDINGDGKVNAKDVTALMKALVNGKSIINFSVADINGDGKVNAKDVTELMRLIIAGK
jgi:peptide methionine sulfoxide reductase MsrB